MPGPSKAEAAITAQRARTSGGAGTAGETVSGTVLGRAELLPGRRTSVEDTAAGWSGPTPAGPGPDTRPLPEEYARAYLS